MVPLRLQGPFRGSRLGGHTWRRRPRRRGSSGRAGWWRAAGLLALLLILAPWASRGEGPTGKGASDEWTTLDSLVHVERSFSALSVRKGMRDAFLHFLADSGLIFRPLAVNGKRAWEGRPPAPGTLIWEPSYADVSAAGDLGYTTGPWEYRSTPDRTDAYGHFISVWRRQPDGRWRVALDIGVSHAKPERGVGSGDFMAGPGAKRGGGAGEAGKAGAAGAEGKPGKGEAAGPGAAGQPAAGAMMAGAAADSAVRAALKALDREYSRAATDSGLAVAFAERATPDVRLNREGALPVIGLAAASAALDSLRGAITWIPQGSGIAASRDLGYTYGVAERVRAGSDSVAASAVPDSSVYLHIWRKGEQRWKLALAVENPLPKRGGK